MTALWILNSYNLGSEKRAFNLYIKGWNQKERRKKKEGKDMAFGFL
jgi:hypothetical protein